MIFIDNLNTITIGTDKPIILLHSVYDAPIETVTTFVSDGDAMWVSDDDAIFVDQ